MKGFFSREQIETQAVRKIDEGVCNCLECGLYRSCISPKMSYNGLGRLKSLILAEAPGFQEDKYNTQLKGPTGDFFKSSIRKHGLDLKRDFYRLNAVNCRPIDGNSNRTPTSKEVNCCRPMVFQTIDEIKPKRWSFVNFSECNE